MLHEIAITPDVFLPQGYDPPELCDACTEGLHRAVLEWCLVRDLRAGAWKQHLRERMSEMPFRTRSFWKNLLKAGRLCQFQPTPARAPAGDVDWCAEALELHQTSPCLGILASSATKSAYQQDRIVASIETRASSAWWNDLESGHPDGPTTKRRLSDYQSRLRPLLRASRGLMFVDPHLDPSRPGYSSFLDMIDSALTRQAPKPSIQIHRCCYEGSGAQRQVIAHQEWERRFRGRWGAALQAKNSKVEVFIWSDLHDRYLLSDLLGIHLGNGFDTSNDISKRVTWTRLSSRDRDNIQRDVDPRVHPDSLIHRFTIQ